MDFFVNDYVIHIATLCFMNIIIVLGLNLITGVTGQLSLGHAAFCSIGAFTAALILINLNMPFWVALVGGALVAAFAGLLIGLPIFRLRGDYLAIATLGFCEIVSTVFMNLEITGEARGINGIPAHTTPLLTFILMVVAIIVMYNLENSKFGLALKSIREDEIASEMMGINIGRYKILAFVIGSAFAGVGGVLYACKITIVGPADFGFMKSVEQLCMLVLGGMGSIVGVVAGVIILTSVPEFLRFASEYRMIMYGIVLIMIMVFRPQGLFGKIKVNL